MDGAQGAATSMPSTPVSRVLDMAQTDLAEYCSLLSAGDEAKECWGVYEYLEMARVSAEQGCVLEGVPGASPAPNCAQLQRLEGIVRELTSRGDIRDLVIAMATLARIEKKAAAAAATKDAVPEAENEECEEEEEHCFPGLPPAVQPHRREQLVQLFKRLDVQCTGTIDAGQFRDAMHSLGDDLSGDSVATIFEAMDIHGFLDLQQFIAIVEVCTSLRHMCATCLPAVYVCGVMGNSVEDDAA